MAEQSDVTLEQAYAMAQAHHQAGNLMVAERTYLDILNSVPNDFTSLHYLGVISYQKGNPQRGIEYINKALNINPDYPDSWNAHAVMLGQLNKHQEAIESFKKAVEIDPEFSMAYSNLGNTYWILHEYEKSKDVCEKAIEIDSNFADAYVNLGAAISRRGENDSEALPIWKKAIEIDPKNANAMINIANAYRNEGKFQKSEEHCLEALKLVPDHPDALNNLGNALRDQGKFEEAEQKYKQATDIRPDFVDAHHNRALTLIDLLRFDEATTAARYVTTFSPDHADAYSTLSVALRETGKIKDAEIAARKSLELNPDSIEARIDLADILFLAEQFAEAELLLEQAMEMEPDSARLYIKMANVHERTNRVEDALEAINKGIKISPEMPQLYMRQANIYMIDNQIEKSLEAINKAMELNPKAVQIYSTKSEILQSYGDMEEAKQMTLKGLELNDQFPALYFTYSKLVKFTEDNPYFIKLIDMVKNEVKFGYGQQTSLNFALFKAYEDIGEHDKAFEHLQKANDLRRLTIVHNPEAQERVFNTIKETYNPSLTGSLEGKGYQSDKPVFIVGMPRSGTTLTEQIISSHPDVYGAGELTNLMQIDQTNTTISAENCKKFGKQYVDSVEEIHPDIAKAKRVTDKMPGNFMKLGQILMTLPNAKIIHCKRNPIDTSLSCYKQLFARGQHWSYNLDELAEHYALYNDLMAFWRKQFPDRFLEINYEDTVNDIDTQARKLIDHVELDWNEACLTPHKSKRAILTASKGQVRKPIYKTSVEAWKRYEKQLTPFAELLHSKIS